MLTKNNKECRLMFDSKEAFKIVDHRIYGKCIPGDFLNFFLLSNKNQHDMEKAFNVEEIKENNYKITAMDCVLGIKEHDEEQVYLKINLTIQKLDTNESKEFCVGGMPTPSAECEIDWNRNMLSPLIFYV